MFVSKHIVFVEKQFQGKKTRKLLKAIYKVSADGYKIRIFVRTLDKSNESLFFLYIYLEIPGVKVGDS